MDSFIVQFYIVDPLACNFTPRWIFLGGFEIACNFTSIKTIIF